MQVIEQHPYIEQVVRPLEGESPAGRGLGEDAALVILEDEIMKIGSLAHTDIDWGKVESESLKILSARSKDPPDCVATGWRRRAFCAFAVFAPARAGKLVG